MSEILTQLNKQKTRLKAAVGVLIERSEPINVIHMMQFSVMALRCEFSTLMAMLAERRPIEEQEYFKRVIDQMRAEVAIMEKALAVMIDENGRVHQLEQAKLLKPGSAGLPS